MKHHSRPMTVLQPYVAPCAGAWIETALRPGKKMATTSPPARGRGLKHILILIQNARSGRPLRGGVD